MILQKTLKPNENLQLPIPGRLLRTKKLPPLASADGRMDVGSYVMFLGAKEPDFVNNLNFIQVIWFYFIVDGKCKKFCYYTDWFISPTRTNTGLSHNRRTIDFKWYLYWEYVENFNEI